MERIDVDESNGYIKTAQITSNGFANALNPEEELSAAHGYRVWGGAYFTEKDGVFPLVNIRNGAAVAYRYYDFGENGSWDILLKGRFFNSGDITIAVNGEIKARICVDRCESFIVTARLNDLCGLADIKLLFNAAHDADILELDVIRFMRK